jgi:hypothetical protein
MPVSSSYVSFNCKIRNPDKTESAVPNQAVHVYDVTHGVLLADLMSDADGVVAGGTLPVPAGTLVRFAFFRAADLECGKLEVTTL